MLKTGFCVSFLGMFCSQLYGNEFVMTSDASLENVEKNDKTQVYVSQRPDKEERMFRSDAVEAKIKTVKKLLKNPYLSWMFENCFPNTLDTTVYYEGTTDDDTFVITGDIDAMWLRDSAAQVWPYLPFLSKDKALRKMVRGVVLRQFQYLRLDPYANAFYKDNSEGEWKSDYTKMIPGLHERKYELDSLCYPIRLAYAYWQETGDTSIFDERWVTTAKMILQTMKEQQRKDGNKTSYRFMRKTHALHDTVSNSGYGHPCKPVGLIASSFRPSDDSTIFPFLIPSNFFAVSVLRKMADVLSKVNKEQELAAQCISLADEVQAAIQKYAVVEHPKYGKIYAFEVDGFGGTVLMDDANVPSLLALPYLCGIPVNDPVYQNTRRFVWSEDNPYFFKGNAGEGIGGPHVGYNYIWPMSIIMKAMTSQDDAEIKQCMQILLQTDAGTGLMHESFEKDDPKDFTRSWFAWTNTLFGELVLDLIDKGKLALLNDLPIPPQTPTSETFKSKKNQK